MRAGMIQPCPQEAEAVKFILQSYLGGESYLTIAGNMEGLGIRYHERTPEWNKHMVKRILENRKYIGADGYPPLLGAGDFAAAQSIRGGKMAGWREQSACVEAAKPKAVCALCGAPIRKESSTRDGVRWWHCGNDECGNTLRMRDDAFERSIIALLNGVIAEPERLTVIECEQPEADAETDANAADLVRLQNELGRELSKQDWNEDYATALIYAVAAEKYNAVGNTSELQRELTALRETLAARPPIETFEIGLFAAVTAAVLMGTNNSLALRLKGGAIIEEGSTEK
jgi:hypothetical protein